MTPDVERGRSVRPRGGVHDGDAAVAVPGRSGPKLGEGRLGRVEAAGEPRPGATSSAAVGLTILSGLFYIVGYALSRTLVTHHGLSALEVTFLRCVVILLAGVVVTAWPGNRLTWRRLLRPDHAWQQRAAAATLVAANAFGVLAYTLLSVTAASALGFTAPLLLALLGGLVLHERVSPGRWLGTLVGFGGMLLVVRPGGETSPLGIAAGFGGALTYAVYQILVRRLREVASTLDTVLQVALVGVVVLAIPVAADWHPVDLRSAGLAVVVTVVQTAALACIAAALRRGEASRLAPWQFSGLLWAMALDAVVVHVAPTAASVVGGLLVIGGGVLAQLLKSPDRG